MKNSDIRALVSSTIIVHCQRLFLLANRNVMSKSLQFLSTAVETYRFERE
jgi:hypothetical protein